MTMKQARESVEELLVLVAKVRADFRTNWLKAQLVATCDHSRGDRLAEVDEHGGPLLTDYWWCQDCGALKRNSAKAYELPKLVALLASVKYSEE